MNSEEEEEGTREEIFSYLYQISHQFGFQSETFDMGLISGYKIIALLILMQQFKLKVQIG